MTNQTSIPLEYAVVWKIKSVKCYPFSDWKKDFTSKGNNDTIIFVSKYHRKKENLVELETSVSYYKI